jgi:hypothetical protein
VREFNRRRLAEAKSHNASKDDLAGARQRVKEIEEELRQITLTPETTKGEERDQRYARVLRLRAMRDDFQSAFPIEQPSRANNLVLALVMTVASFMLCAFCAGSAYLGVHLVNQQPDPVSIANGFWAAMVQGDYSAARTGFFSPVLREQLTLDTFTNQAAKVDKQYGQVTNYTLVKESGDLKSSASLTYTITRSNAGNAVTYKVILQLTTFHGAWGVSDLGNTLDPHAGGAPAATVTATAAAGPSPSATSGP